MKALESLARLLGLPAHQAEDALHSERAARLVLSRRGFIGASALLAVGSAFSFAPAKPFSSVQLLLNGQVIQSWQPGERIYSYRVPPTALSGDRNDVVEMRRVACRGVDFVFR